MLSLQNGQNTKNFLITISTLAASTVLVHSISKIFMPSRIRRFIFPNLHSLSCHPFSSQLNTIVIEEYKEHHLNQMFQAVNAYLTFIVNTSNGRENQAEQAIGKDQEIPDVFQNVQVSWKLVFTKIGSFDNRIQYATAESEIRSFELTFHEKHRETMLNSYLHYILEHREAKKIQKTLVLDSEIKRAVWDDFNTFVNAKEFYGRIGKAWKRNYLLNGPPGSGKSSLIAAMANHLNYDVYELDLAVFPSDFNYNFFVDRIPNRSVLVIKNVDCRIEQPENPDQNEEMLLHCTDGLWSCCGNERIIIFTATHKETVSPALLRPGRIDMNIHMPYCSISTFKQLAFHYLEIQHHELFQEIEGLLEEAEVTREEVLGELKKNSDVGVSFQGLVEFLHRKKLKMDEAETSTRVDAKEWN
ncbi:hypothetical protein P3X46_003507 [Hevea brasiliensis]|uniref:AAA+ ATPase domain-containing protein n=1 Tax=Hevea brasiliensis TaxID=3981 RepID=A0ABQ9N860_HEVBR|nr:hypothetical protein P3X46_003507 [Hevea brasiliensis]